MYCYQQNTLDDWLPDVNIVSTMLVDEDCPLCSRDIVSQKNNWNPNTPFKNTGAYGHTLSEEITSFSFRTMYENYLVSHPDLDGNKVPDYVSAATARATSNSNLPIWIKNFFAKHVDDCIKQMIKDGHLTRNVEQPRPRAGGPRPPPPPP